MAVTVHVAQLIDEASTTHGGQTFKTWVRVLELYFTMALTQQHPKQSPRSRSAETRLKRG